MQVKKSMKKFYTVWIGQLISTIGSGLTGFALGVWLYQETGSVTLYSMSFLAMLLPRMLLAPFAGVVADRYDRRLIMLLSDVGAGLSTVVVGLLFWNGSLAVWHVIVAELVNSFFGTFQDPAYTAATTLLVPKDRLGNANGLMQMARAISRLLSPALAGVLFVVIGLTGIVAIDFATFIVAVGTLTFIRFPQPENRSAIEDKSASMWQEVKAGLRYIRSHAGMVWLLGYFAIINLFASMIGPLILPLLLEQTTPDKFGYISSIIGVGMLVGTILLSTWGGPERRIVGIIGSIALGGLFTMLLGFPSLWIITLGGFLVMLVMPIGQGINQTLWQVKVPPELQGRVFSIFSMIGYSSPVIAAIVVGPLAERVFEPLLMEGGGLAGNIGRIIGTGTGRGTAFMFILIGLLQFSISVLAWLHPRIRNLEDEIPDAIPDDPLEQTPLVAAA